MMNDISARDEEFYTRYERFRVRVRELRGLRVNQFLAILDKEQKRRVVLIEKEVEDFVRKYAYSPAINPAMQESILVLYNSDIIMRRRIEQRIGSPGGRGPLAVPPGSGPPGGQLQEVSPEPAGDAAPQPPAGRDAGSADRVQGPAAAAEALAAETASLPGPPPAAVDKAVANGLVGCSPLAGRDAPEANGSAGDSPPAGREAAGENGSAGSAPPQSPDAPTANGPSAGPATVLPGPAANGGPGERCTGFFLPTEEQVRQQASLLMGGRRISGRSLESLCQALRRRLGEDSTPPAKAGPPPAAKMVRLRLTDAGKVSIEVANGARPPGREAI
jgi:hypothetical protein